jgi:sugar phosphate isomerase/epimerase
VPASNAFSRRGFLGAAPAAIAMTHLLGSSTNAASFPGKPAWHGLKVGIASYTFSKLPLDEAIKAIVRVGVNYVSIKDAHLSLKSSAAERLAVVKKFKAAGITPVSCGVITTNDEESNIRVAFEYARDAAIPVIVCKPTRASLPTVERLVKEFDIKVAIHNHGPEDKVWPSPLDAWEAIKKLDERIGVCIDVGHTQRTGTDPVAAFRTCAPRLYDLHIKDISSKEGNSKPVEVGRGVLDVKGILQALVDIDYKYHVGLEYEKDMKDPLPGAAESMGYIRAVLAGMK